MSDLFDLRPYQREAIKAVNDDFATGLRRVAVVCATGLGKTVIFSHMTADYLASLDGEGVLILVDRDELVDQTVEKLNDVAAGFKVGVVKADRNDVLADVIVGSVQTLRNPTRLAQLRPIGLLIIDECDLSAAPSYVKIMTDLGCFDPERSTRLIGVTATLVRNDGKELGAIYEKVSYTRDILDGIADGYLTDVSGKRVEVEGLTLPELQRRGDFGDASLSEIMSSPAVRRNVVESYTEHASSMPGIVFVPSVQTAFDFTEAFDDAGYSVAAVWGAMPKDDRKRVIADYREGRIQVLINCQALTRGFDAPRAQCAVIARPTTSASLYVQMVGRVLRPFPGKAQALVLDVVGASDDHRLATIADLTSRRIEEIKEGETLRQAVEREKKARNPRFAEYVIDVEEVDLFGRSRSAWLQTYGGVWFLPVMNAAVFIWPGKDDHYRVGIRPTGRPGGRFIRNGVTLDAALSWGEQTADRYAMSFVDSFPGERKEFDRSRRASWRRQPPSRPQLNEATRIGLTLPIGATPTRGELSDMINIHKISQLLDPKGK